MFNQAITNLKKTKIGMQLLLTLHAEQQAYRSFFNYWWLWLMPLILVGICTALFGQVKLSLNTVLIINFLWAIFVVSSYVLVRPSTQQKTIFYLFSYYRLIIFSALFFSLLFDFLFFPFDIQNLFMYGLLPVIAFPVFLMADRISLRGWGRVLYRLIGIVTLLTIGIAVVCCLLSIILNATQLRYLLGFDWYAILLLLMFPGVMTLWKALYVVTVYEHPNSFVSPL